MSTVTGSQFIMSCKSHKRKYSFISSSSQEDSCLSESISEWMCRGPEADLKQDSHWGPLPRVWLQRLFHRTAEAHGRLQPPFTHLSTITPAEAPTPNISGLGERLPAF